MPFARYYSGRCARAFTGAVCAALIVAVGQSAVGQDRQPRVTRPAAKAKPADAPGSKAELPASTKPNSPAPSAKQSSNPAPPSADSKLTFSFRYQPWQEVL